MTRYLRRLIERVTRHGAAHVGRLAVFLFLASSALPAVALAKKPVGRIDGANTDSIFGWTCDPDAYGAELWVHLYEGDTFIGAAHANLEREAAVGTQCGRGHTRHGYGFQWPASLRDGREHKITVYAIDNEGGENPPLRTSNGNKAFMAVTIGASPIGWVDHYTQTALVGWACDPDSFGTQLWMHIYEGNTFIGAVQANGGREAAVGQSCGGGHSAHGFVFVWPESLRDGRVHNITAYAIDNEVAASPPLPTVKSGGRVTYTAVTLHRCGSSCAPAGAVGVCATGGSWQCVDGKATVCTSPVRPQPETCDNLGRDDDCNGTVDDGAGSRRECEICGNQACRYDETCSSCQEDCGVCASQGEWYRIGCVCSDTTASSVGIYITGCLTEANNLGFAADCTSLGTTLQSRSGMPTSCVYGNWWQKDTSHPESCTAVYGNWINASPTP